MVIGEFTSHGPEWFWEKDREMGSASAIHWRLLSLAVEWPHM